MWLPGFEFPSVLIYEPRCLPSFLSQPVGLHGAGRRWTETNGWHQDAVTNGVSEWCGLNVQMKPGDARAGEPSEPGMEKAETLLSGGSVLLPCRCL